MKILKWIKSFTRKWNWCRNLYWNDKKKLKWNWAGHKMCTND